MTVSPLFGYELVLLLAVFTVIPSSLPSPLKSDVFSLQLSIYL
jgi:hypothetical protein